MKKKLITGLMLLLIVISLTGCGEDKETAHSLESSVADTTETEAEQATDDALHN